MSVFLTVVIPAYNEASRLSVTLRAAQDYCGTLGKMYEILVVDDGSTDNIAAVVKEFQLENSCVRMISHFPNRGKGYAVRQGMLHAIGEFVLFMDADLSTPVDEMNHFFPHLEKGIRVVIGTRKHRSAEILRHQPIWRESMGKVFTWLSNLILGLRVSDFTCGFKAFHRDAAHRIFNSVSLPGWAFDSELLFLAHRYGFSIAEVPVRWINSPESKVHVLSATVDSLLALFRIRINAFLGKYDRPESASVEPQADVDGRQS